MEFNTEAKGAKPQPSSYVWSAPFNPAQHIPPGKDIYAVTYSGNGKTQTITVFGDYIAPTSDKKSSTDIMTGRPIADADGNAANARLTQDGGLTSAGVAFCHTHGLQADIESLTKSTKIHTPANLKYQGYEQKPQPA